MLRTRTSRLSRRALGAGPLILLFALALNVSYYDHWSEHLGFTHNEESAEATEVHQGHCHLNPATCSDQPLPPGPQMTWEIIEVKEPDLPTIIAHNDDTTPGAGFVMPVPTDPPRFV